MKALHPWFQTFAVFSMLYVFFWVIPRRLNFLCRRFGTLCLFHLYRQVGVEWLNLVILHLPAYEDGSVFRNVGIYNSDAGELPRRKHTKRHYIPSKRRAYLSLETVASHKTWIFIFNNLISRFSRDLIVCKRFVSSSRVSFFTLDLLFLPLWK
jgi:hypothetical protein